MFIHSFLTEGTYLITHCARKWLTSIHKIIYSESQWKLWGIELGRIYRITSCITWRLHYLRFKNCCHKESKTACFHRTGWNGCHLHITFSCSVCFWFLWQHINKEYNFDGTFGYMLCIEWTHSSFKQFPVGQLRSSSEFIGLTGRLRCSPPNWEGLKDWPTVFPFKPSFTGS